MVVQSLGPIIAPVLGGYIMSFSTWQAIFVFLIVFGIFCFIATIFQIPETLPESERQAESFSRLPGVFRDLLCTRDFVVPTLASSIGLASMFVFISGSPYVFMELYGVEQKVYGWLFGLNACGMIITSWLNRYFLKKFTPTQILAGGLCFAIIMSGTAVLVSSTHHLWLLIVPLFACLSMVPVIGANGVAVAMAATGKHAGSGSSVIGVLQFGIAALASGLVSLFHNGTPYPMTVLIFAVSLIATTLFWFGRSNTAAHQNEKQ